MKITHFIHTDVAPNGKLPAGGAVEIDGRQIQSAPSGGCGNEGCQCSPGHWITKTFPRTDDGIVFGYRAEFDTREELEQADMALIEREARNQLN